MTFWSRAVLTFTRGAALTLSSTAVSCLLAIQVERVGHRILFSVAPHLYSPVDQAAGLSEEDLQYARQMAQQRELAQMGALAQRLALDCALTTTNANAIMTDDMVWRRTPDSNHNNNLFQFRVPSDEEMILESAPL